MFQRNWVVMKEHVIAGVKEFFRTGLMPDGINNTSIVLIPKVDKPAKLSDFRPISLTLSVAKIFAKLRANRVRKRMKEIVTVISRLLFVGGISTITSSWFVRWRGRFMHVAEQVFSSNLMCPEHLTRSPGRSYFKCCCKRVLVPNG